MVRATMLATLVGLILGASNFASAADDDNQPPQTPSTDKSARGVRDAKPRTPDGERPPARPGSDVPSRRDWPKGPGDFGHAPGSGGPPHGGHGGHRFGGNLRERDPEMARLYERDAELDRQTHELADMHRSAPPGEARAEVLDKLKQAVADHFKVRQERRELELKRLEEQLDGLRASVKKRDEQKDEIIEQRLMELLGKPEDLKF